MGTAIRLPGTMRPLPRDFIEAHQEALRESVCPRCGCRGDYHPGSVAYCTARCKGCGTVFPVKRRPTEADRRARR